MKKALARPSAPVRDLKKEYLLARLEAEPNDALKFTVRPLTSELPRPNEPLKDLNNETCFRKPPLKPSEALKLFATPLV